MPNPLEPPRRPDQSSVRRQGALGRASRSEPARGSGSGPGRVPARPDGLRLAGVLGGLEMTAADSAVQTIVDQLDFESYKELVRGLTRFGDREQGTERNARAIDWIEEQLRGWGLETGARLLRVHPSRGR